jgi:hypothetical protein
MKSRAKVSAEQPGSSQVQVFSALTEMRYKPATEHGTQILLKQQQKLGKKNKDYADLHDPVTMTQRPPSYK